MIQVINRALDIMEYLAEDPGEQKTLGEIADKLGLNSATCANILKTLVERKYVEKLQKKKGYCLGAKAYGLTGNDGYKKDVTEAALEVMEQLVIMINENLLLSVLDNDMRRVLVRVMSTHPIQASIKEEKRAYDSASGRALVGLLSDDDLERFIRRFGLPHKEEWEGVKDKSTLLAQIAHIRETGYAMQLTKEKIIGFAVPVYKADKVIASLSVYLPQFRFKRSATAQLVNLLKQSSNKISKKLT